MEELAERRAKKEEVRFDLNFLLVFRVCWWWVGSFVWCLVWRFIERGRRKAEDIRDPQGTPSKFKINFIIERRPCRSISQTRLGVGKRARKSRSTPATLLMICRLCNLQELCERVSAAVVPFVVLSRVWKRRESATQISSSTFKKRGLGDIANLADNFVSVTRHSPQNNTKHLGNGVDIWMSKSISNVPERHPPHILVDVFPTRAASLPCIHDWLLASSCLAGQLASNPRDYRAAEKDGPVGKTQKHS